jgi:hypothetical protein
MSAELAQSLGFDESEGVAGFRPTDVNTNADGITEASFDAQQVQELAKTQLDFLAALAMPAIFKYCFPPVFQSVWAWLLEYVHKTRDFSQLALGLPRGFGKTILMKLFILYCILFTNKKFILILCSTQTKANNIVSDVIDILNEPNIQATFGDWRIGIETDRQDLKKFGFRGRNIILMAAGADTDVRGITLKNERPDVMLFDDIQSRACADSDIQSETLEREIIGTVMKAKSPHGCLYIFVANMYPTKFSLLRKLKKNPNWIKFIAGGILADGTSLWEELQPIKQLLREYENDLASGHPEIFYSEVLNDENANINSLIDLSKIPQYPFEPNDIPTGKFVIIDPSNDKAQSDKVSLGYFEILNGYPVIKKTVEGTFSPGETIRQALKLCFETGAAHIGVESTAYQYSLLYWFGFICEQQGIIGINALELYSGSTPKNVRIVNMFKALLAGEIWISPDMTYTNVSTDNTPGMTGVGATPIHLQIMQFNPLRRDNTDGLLDLLTYGPKMIELYGAEIVSRATISEQESMQARVIEYNSPF